MISKRKLKKYPYIILGIIHIAMMGFTFYKKKDRKQLLVLYLSYTGFAYWFEYIVFALLKGYVYKPKVFKIRSLDHVFGSVWSQFLYVPTTALFITAFQLGWKVKLFFSIYFSLVEKIFLYLGIFKNHWWKTRYTFVMIFISFIANDKWSEKLQKNNPYVRFISLFQMVQVTWSNLNFLLTISGEIRYGKSWGRPWKKHFKVAPLVNLLDSLLVAWWLKSGDFLSKLKSFLFMWSLDYFLIKQRRLKVDNYLLLPFFYMIIIFMGDHYYRNWIYRPYQQDNPSSDKDSRERS